MIAPSANRVQQNTAPDVNERIRLATDARIAFYSDHPHLIARRLHELDEEWDIERALATGSSALSLFGLGMSLLRSRKWLILTGAVQGFYMQHALQGWCPPLPVFRRLGFRTPMEIDFERCALKAVQHNYLAANCESARESEEFGSCGREKASSAAGMVEPRPEATP